MFQFSLFSSFIPYLTIAVMYVLYLGVYTCNKLNAEHEPFETEEAVENTVSWEKLTTLSAQKTMQVPDELFFADDLAAEPAAVPEPFPLLSTIRILPEPSGEIPVTGCLCFNLFSRPPPQIS